MTGSALGLSVKDVIVRFGGLTAVNGVSIDVLPARLTGLIGPNGAGKTTIFNTCSGLIRPSEGSIHLNGEDISRLSPHERAQRGLGRTFQRMELYDRLTVAENVALGCEARMAGARRLGALRATRDERHRTLAARDEAIDMCGLQDIAYRPAGLLSSGQRRLVELGRALAGRYEILLLDEPSSGLDPHESDRFGAILRRIVAEQGTGVLLVEHDMALVRAICEVVYAVDFGQLVAYGPTEEVLRSDVIKAAYLGSEFVG